MQPTHGSRASTVPTLRPPPPGGLGHISGGRLQVSWSQFFWCFFWWCHSSIHVSHSFFIFSFTQFQPHPSPLVSHILAAPFHSKQHRSVCPNPHPFILTPSSSPLHLCTRQRTCASSACLSVVLSVWLCGCMFVCCLMSAAPTLPPHTTPRHPSPSARPRGSAGLRYSPTRPPTGIPFLLTGGARSAPMPLACQKRGTGWCKVGGRPRNGGGH